MAEHGENSGTEETCVFAYRASGGCRRAVNRTATRLATQLFTRRRTNRR